MTQAKILDLMVRLRGLAAQTKDRGDMILAAQLGGFADGLEDDLKAQRAYADGAQVSDITS